MKKLLLLSIRLYQRVFSHTIHGVFLGGCRFHPTCSVYLYEAIVKHGIISGLLLGLKRLLRCYPWGAAGYDPVPKEKI